MANKNGKSQDLTGVLADAMTAQGDEPKSAGAESEPTEDAGGTGQRGVSRRQMLKLAAGAVITVPLASKIIDAAAAPRSIYGSRLSPSASAAVASVKAETAADGPTFFTKDEYAMLDELTEMIIPTDDHSPGARAAKVAEYIDKRLAEEFEDKVKQGWRNGLKAVNDLSQQMNQRTFMESSAEQRHSVLAKMAEHENAPTADSEKFFGELKSWTVFGYYSTKIGIHQEIEYKGNVYQQEFSGYDAT